MANCKYYSNFLIYHFLNYVFKSDVKKRHTLSSLFLGNISEERVVRKFKKLGYDIIRMEENYPVYDVKILEKNVWKRVSIKTIRGFKNPFPNSHLYGSIRVKNTDAKNFDYLCAVSYNGKDIVMIPEKEVFKNKIVNNNKTYFSYGLSKERLEKYKI